MNNQPIELNRHFLVDSGHEEISESLLRGDSATHARGLWQEATWNDLLQMPRVIILAEAGMGKTAELERREFALCKTGKYAFRCFAEAVAVGSNDFRKAFTTPEDAKRFDEWLNSNAIGYFLIDALDEASVSTVEGVFRLLGHALADALGRSRIYVASRVSEWHHERYIRAFRESLKFPPVKSGAIAGGDQNAHRVARLRPLNREQQERLANARFEVKDAEKMLDEAVRIVGEHAVNRPLDLRATSRYWLEHKKIGSRMDMMKYFVNTNLGEWDTGRKQKKGLSLGKAQEGAEILAAARVLHGEKDGIQMGDSKVDAMNAREALPKEWDDDKIAALLELPIFGSESYGVVRFHHREARDYLAASWFKRMLDSGASPLRILSAFEVEKGHEIFIRPTMRPIAAWLTRMEWGTGKFSRRMSKLDPVAMMFHGDPSVLPSRFREDVLCAAAQKIADNLEAERIYDIPLERFEGADIANVVNKLLDKFSDNPNVVEFLLRVVGEGKIVACADKALDIVLNESTTENLRYSAIYAVADASTRHAKKLAGKVVDQADKWSGRDLARAMSRLFPKSMNIRQFVQCIEKKTGRWAGLADESYLLKNIPLEGMTTEELRKFLNGILTTAKARAKRSGRRAESLTATLAAKALMPILDSSDAPHEDEDILRAIEDLEKYKGMGFSERHDIVKKISANWRLTHALYWRAFQREYLIQWSVSDMSGLSHHSPELFQAFLQDLRTQSDAKKREEVFNTIWRFWLLSARENSDILAEIWAAVASDGELSEKLEKSLERSAKWKRRWKREETVRLGRERQKKEEKEKELRESVEILRKMSTQLCDFDAEAALNIVNALLYLQNWMLDNKPKSADESDSDNDSCDWKSMIPVFGEEVARCARDGIMKFWRTYTPALISEVRNGRNSWSTDSRVFLGLFGLDILHRQQPGWATQLTKDETARAARYATHCSTRFPEWFVALVFSKHQNAVGKIMRPEMEKDICQFANNASPNILPVMLHNDEALGKYFARMALNILEANPAVGRNARYYVARLLRFLKGDDATKRKVNFYRGRIAKKNAVDEQTFWLTEWMRVDADAALEELERHLQEIDNSDDAKKFMVNFCGSFGDETRAHNTQGLREVGLWGNISRLRQILHLTLQYVRYEDDINRAGGGAYIPEIRDHAQDFRGALFNHLVSECSGKEAYHAMIKLSAAPALDDHTRGILRVYARKCAEREARAKLLFESPAEIAAFAEKHTPPFRQPSIFFQHILSVLEELQDNLENGDFSNAPLLALGNEAEAQLWFADRLRERGRGVFTVDREETVIRGNKPDIRVRSVEGDGVVSVEMKIADNWSFGQLQDALETQLPQYLCDPKTRHGILLFVYKGKKKWKISSHLANFAKLTETLDNHAKELVGKKKGIDDIRVIGIDLSQAEKSNPPPRSSRKKASKAPSTKPRKRKT